MKKYKPEITVQEVGVGVKTEIDVKMTPSEDGHWIFDEDLEKTKDECKWCGHKLIPEEDRDECNNCWEMRTRIGSRPDLAYKMLTHVDGIPLHCNCQGQLFKAKEGEAPFPNNGVIMPDQSFVLPSPHEWICPVHGYKRRS